LINFVFRGFLKEEINIESVSIYIIFELLTPAITLMRDLCKMIRAVDVIAEAIEMLVFEIVGTLFPHRDIPVKELGSRIFILDMLIEDNERSDSRLCNINQFSKKANFLM
jgi:hypothetical protein